MKQLTVSFKFNNQPVETEIINEDRLDDYFKVKKASKKKHLVYEVPTVRIDPYSGGEAYRPLGIPATLNRSSVTAQVGGGALTREALQNAYDSLLNDSIVENNPITRIRR